MTTFANKYWAYFCLLIVACISLYFKLGLITAGAPYTTIDDNTLFNAGFLVWFGEAPPQRMYLESWIAGISEIFTYISHLISTGHLRNLGLNLVADAFRDFQQDPYDYVRNYRLLMVFFDLLTAHFIYRTARLFFPKGSATAYYAIVPACLFLLSFNTLWCDLVARPDTLTAFFAALGIYAYYKSDFGNYSNYFYLAAVALGCATGMKLHAAFFVVAITIDLIRFHGFKYSLKYFIPFGVISVVLFSVTAGSPLFAPLLYVKLRALNALDDASPWIHWGNQFIVAVKATGWLIIPAVVATSALYLLKRKSELTQPLKSLLLISWLFLLLFLSLRVLRGYWMLPALPLFYILATQALVLIRGRLTQVVTIAIALGVFSVQLFQQSQVFKQARYTELQDWVKANVKPDQSIYILGYEIISLPLNTKALENRKAVLQQLTTESIANNESFTARHVRLWEERAGLVTIDMLNEKFQGGYEYYSLNAVPEKYFSTIGTPEFTYLIVLSGLHTPEVDEFLKKHLDKYRYLTTKNAPGGSDGVGGLAHDIYINKSVTSASEVLQ